MPELSSILNSTWGIALALFFLGSSIFVHELGHLLAAKKRGLKIERFSIGFGPKLFSWTREGIEYQLSLLPLGGYVKLPQMVELETLEGESRMEAEKLPPISCSDKIIVSVMGAVFNLFFALAICTVLWIVGVPSNQLAESTRIGYVAETIQSENGTKIPGPAYAAGLRPGDNILKIDGVKVRNFEYLATMIAVGTGRNSDGQAEATFTIEREGKIMDIVVNPAFVETSSFTGRSGRDIGIWPYYPIVVGTLFEPSPAHEAGLQPGDEITHINQERVFAMGSLIPVIQKHAGKPVELTILREGKVQTIEMTPRRMIRGKPLAILELDGKNSLELVTVFDDADSSIDRTATTSAGDILVYQAKTTDTNSPLKDLKTGQRIQAINQIPVHSVEQIFNQLNAGDTLSLTLQTQQGEQTLHLGTLAQVAIDPAPSRVMIGFGMLPAHQQTLIVHHDPLTQMYDHAVKIINTIKGLLHPQSDVGISDMNGPIMIGRTIHYLAGLDFRLVLWLTALINVNLALFNLLPIPVLDGGHVMFALINKIRRHPLPSKVIINIQGTFMFMLLSLMLFIMFNDSFNWWQDSERAAHIQKQQELTQLRFLPNEFVRFED